MRRSSKSTEKIMSSTATTAPAMGSSIMTGRPIGRSKRWMVGKKSSPFLKSTSKDNWRSQQRSPVMCTMIVHQAKIDGRGRGAGGWFKVQEANVSYDHPYDMPLEHALNIDFVNEAEGPGARVAVELSVEAARNLVKTIEAVLAQAESRGVLEDAPAGGAR